MRLKLDINIESDSPKDIFGVIQDFSSAFQRTMERGELNENMKFTIIDNTGKQLASWEFEID